MAGSHWFDKKNPFPHMQQSNLKILVRLPNWLGDLVMSAAFLDHLKKVYAGCQVDVIIKKGIDQLIPYFMGISEVFVFDKKEYSGLKGALKFGQLIGEKKQYDLAFCLPDSFSSAAMIWQTRAQKRVGFKKELRSPMLTNSYKKPANKHRVEEYLYLLEKFSGRQCDTPVVRLKNNHEPIPDQIIINVNSEADSRRLPVAKAASIINHLSNRTNAKLVLVGSPKELHHVTAVYNLLPNKSTVFNLAGKTDLNGLVKLFSQSRVMLTTDSGPMHLANALGVHTVALEGASDEKNTAPYNQLKSTLIRYGQLPCEPCVKNTCQFGEPECLLRMDEQLIVNEVLKAYARKETIEKQPGN